MSTVIRRVYRFWMVDSLEVRRVLNINFSGWNAVSRLKMDLPLGSIFRSSLVVFLLLVAHKPFYWSTVSLVEVVQIRATGSRWSIEQKVQNIRLHIGRPTINNWDVRPSTSSSTEPGAWRWDTCFRSQRLCLINRWKRPLLNIIRCGVYTFVCVHMCLCIISFVVPSILKSKDIRY